MRPNPTQLHWSCVNSINKPLCQVIFTSHLVFGWKKPGHIRFSFYPVCQPSSRTPRCRRGMLTCVFCSYFPSGTCVLMVCEAQTHKMFFSLALLWNKCARLTDKPPPASFLILNCLCSFAGLEACLCVCVYSCAAPGFSLRPASTHREQV